MQIRVEGEVQKLSAAESDNYFHRYKLPQAANGILPAAALACTATLAMHASSLMMPGTLLLTLWAPSALVVVYIAVEGRLCAAVGHVAHRLELW